MSHPIVPHFAFPFRVRGSHAQTVEQDTLEDLSMCVEVLVATERGSRLELPAYGIDQLPLRTRINHNALLGAISEWEPRVTASIIESYDGDDPLIRHLAVKISRDRETT